MSSLLSILNPTDKPSRRSSRLRAGSELAPSANDASPSPTSDISGNTAIDLVQQNQDDPADKDHQFHPDCPDTLACLPDTDGRPQHTLPVILRCAILGSPRKRLTIREIYAAMEEKYPYYRTAGPTWKQSVRHHLSLNRLFERQPRPVTDPGFGSYWTVNLAAPPGTKRPRKRGRPNKEVTVHDDTIPPNKRRGRPRKATVPPSPRAEHDDEEMLAFEENEVSPEDEFESEEDMVYPFEHRESIAATRAYHGSSSSRPSAKRLFEGFDDDNVIDRLQIEISGLKRQSQDALAVSLRMSDQLAEAQAEISRARAELKSVERMLEAEATKRREAEKALDDEVRRRRILEDTMSTQATPPSSSVSTTPGP